MKRDEETLWLNAALDGELDLERSVAMEAQLARDPQFKAAWDRERALRSAIREGANYHNAPEALRTRLGQMLNAETASSRRPPGRGIWVAMLGDMRWRIAASSLMTALLTFAVTWQIMEVRHGLDGVATHLAEDVVDGHIRAAMTERLVEVTSSDQHTVRPWLAARLTYAPAVPDLSMHGFELLGARREVLDGQPVAALVYRRRQHVISAYVRASTSRAELKVRAVRGFNVVESSQNGMAYWIVSDLNGNELRDFTELLEGR